MDKPDGLKNYFLKKTISVFVLVIITIKRLLQKPSSFYVLSGFSENKACAYLVQLQKQHQQNIFLAWFWSVRSFFQVVNKGLKAVLLKKYHMLKILSRARHTDCVVLCFALRELSCFVLNFVPNTCSPVR